MAGPETARNTDSFVGPTTAALSAFAAHTRPGDLPGPVIEETRRIILDSVGCAIGGMLTKKGKLVARLIADLGGREEATVMGTDRRTNPPQAAFANGELINALDAEPVLFNIGHVIPCILAAVLGAAEARRSSGAEVIAALAVGHEIAARLTLALLPLMRSGEPPDDRWVISPVSGHSYAALGAAAAAGTLLGLSEERPAHAIGLASYFAAVPAHLKWVVTNPRSMVKYTPMGLTAQAGVLAALLAETGYTGDTSSLDGERGFWQFWGSPRCDVQVLHEELGKTWYSMQGTSYKPYPACNLYRPHFAMLEQILGREGLAAEEIDQVTLSTRAVTSADYDPRTFSAVESDIDVHMSGEYAVALIAHRIPPGPQWIAEETLHDAAVQQFMKKVRIVGNPTTRETAYEAAPARIDPAVLRRVSSTIEVRARGRTFRDSADYGKGDCWAPPGWRMREEELEAKFRTYAAPVLGSERVEHLVQALRSLERADDICRVMELTRSAG